MVQRGNGKNHLKFPYRKTKWSGGRFISERGKYKNYSEIKQEIEKIKEVSETKTKILKDENLYFIVTFTEKINSPNINRLINNYPSWKIIKIISDQSVKFSLKNENYPNFLTFLEKKKEYFSNIRCVTLKDSFSKELLNELTNVEINRFNILIELSSTLSHEEEDVKKSIQEYLNKANKGEIKTFEKIGYNILCSLSIKKDYIKELVAQIDGINNVQKEYKPKLDNFYLQGIEERTTKSHKVRLTQMPTSSTEEVDVDKLPLAGVLDSGISNPNNRFDSNLIESTYDFGTDQEGPCNDGCGHGTFVSGRVIHGGDISINPPTCKVIAVKVFKDYTSLVRTDKSLLSMINSTIKKFNEKTRVYNLSFCIDGIDPTFSKRLDYIANENNVLFVNSSGNFDYNDIKYYLNNGLNYPEYLTKLHVYPPADCFNVLTVGSHTNKGSNFCPERAPSPFTRCFALENRTKPEILCEGGNLTAVYTTGRITNFSDSGLTVWSYSHETGRDYAEGIGTSYAAPIATAIAGQLLHKYKKNSINLIKAFIINSCTLLQDQTGQPFDQNVQGFGSPDGYHALNSSKSRVTLFSEAEFDLKEKDKYAHEYRFHVPRDVWRTVITIVFTNPVEEHTLPGKLAVGLKYEIRKAGVKSKKSKPTVTFCKDNDNVIHCIYDVKRGGRGTWTLKLKPRIFLPIKTKYLKYAVVVTQIASGSINIYDEIENSLKP